MDTGGMLFRGCAALAAAAWVSASMAADASLQIARNAKADCEVIAPEAGPERHAANEITNWLGRITGAEIMVLSSPSAAGNTKIFVGREFAAKLYGDDLAAIGETDGFAVRFGGAGARSVHVFGNIPRGTINGAAAFLENSTDIIWPRAEIGLEAVHGEDTNLAIPAGGGYREIPKTKFRAFQWTYHSAGKALEAWARRNRLNRDGDPAFGGMYRGAGFGHGLQRFVDPKVYFDKHPEFYPERNGKRTPSGGQLCFTAVDKFLPLYVENIAKHLEEYTAKNCPGTRPEDLSIQFLNISIGDGWNVCNCKECLAPFRCEDGAIVDPKDPVFRSAQYYTLVNKVAREVAKRYPKVDVGVYAYIFTAEPPPFKLEKNVRVQYCPFVRDDKANIFDDNANRNWHDYLDRWGVCGNNVWVRDYFGWANTFPRPIEYTVAKDVRYCIERGIREFSAEHPVDSESKVYPPSKGVWDVSSMTAWLIARLWWNPDVDIETLRGHYLERTYREAAPAMRRYHNLIRDSFYASKAPSLYSDELLPMVSAYIVRPGIADQCRAALKEALAAAKHPVSRTLIERQIGHLETWIEKAGIDKTVRLTVPVCTEKDILSSFDSDIWKKAGNTGPFVVADAERKYAKAIFRSEARLLHDRENLYIMFDCHADDMATLKANVSENDGTERIPRGDIMEFFLANPGTGAYWQFMFDVGNEDPAKDVVYDAQGYDPQWTCPWKRSIRRYDDRWTAIVSMPLASFGINVTQNNKLLFLPIRGKYYTAPKPHPKTGGPWQIREMASWGGGWVHQVSSFGELTLSQN